MTKGIIIPCDSWFGLNYESFHNEKYDFCQTLNHCLDLSNNMPGRILRRLPFLTFVYNKMNPPIQLNSFMIALKSAISYEKEETKYLKEKTH